MNIQIYKNNFDLTDPFKQYLEEKFSALSKYHENILSFKVELNRDQKHNKGDVFTIEAHLQLPHHKSLIVREKHIDARAAVDIAQEKLARQLLKIKDKQNSRIKKTSRLLRSMRFWNKNQE
ncbi:MAG: ribosome-associated translation inhibitor RaiA [Patescibacteria group bacterium]